MKLSFIVAAYNVEKYIECCVKSIIRSLGDRTDYEVIIINDGSTDNTSIIIKEISQKYAGIKLVGQENSGVSVVRNNGLKIAEGEWVFFIDGDDYITDKTSEIFYKFIDSCNGVDAIVFPADCVILGKTKPFFETKGTIVNAKSMDIFVKLLEDDYSFGWCAWHYAFRRKFLIENEVFFPAGRVSEEMYFTLRMFLKADKISVFGRFPVYTYRMDNMGSVSRTASYKFVNDLLYMMKSNLPTVNGINDARIRNLVKLNYQTLAIVVISLYTSYSKEQKKEIIKNLGEIEEIYIIDKKYRHYYKIKERIVQIMVKFFGFHFVGVLWGIKKKLWR